MDTKCKCEITVERMIREIEKLEEVQPQGYALSYLHEAAEMLRNYQVEVGQDNG